MRTTFLMLFLIFSSILSAQIEIQYNEQNLKFGAYDKITFSSDNKSMIGIVGSFGCFKFDIEANNKKILNTGYYMLNQLKEDEYVMKYRLPKETTYIVYNPVKEEIIKSVKCKHYDNITISKDYKHALYFKDNNYTLIDLENCKEIKTYEVDKYSERNFIFMPNNSDLLVGNKYSEDNPISICKATSGKKVEEFSGVKHSKAIKNFSFSPNGKYMISYDAFEVILYNVEERKAIQKLSGFDVYISLAKFLPSGNKFAIVYGNKIQIRDINTFEVVNEIIGAKNKVNYIGASIDDKYLISTSSEKSSKLWDIITGEELLTFHFESTRWFAYTPNGYFDGDDFGLKLLYVKSGSDSIPIDTYKEKYYKPNLIKLVLEGKIERAEKNEIADNEQNKISEKEIDNTPRLVIPTGHVHEIFDCDVSNDNKYLVSCSKDELILWDVETEKQLWKVDYEYSRYSYNGYSLSFLSDNMICFKNQIHDYRTGEKTEILCNNCIYGEEFNSIAVNKTDRFEFTEIPSGKLIKSIKNPFKEVVKYRISHKGNKLLLLADQKVHIYDVETQKITASYELEFSLKKTEERQLSIGFSPDDKSFYVYRQKYDEKIPTTFYFWKNGNSAPEKIVGKEIRNPTFSPDGKYFVYYSNTYKSGTIILYKTESLKEIKTLRFDKKMGAVRFTKDSKKIIVALNDNVQLFDLFNLETPEKTFKSNSMKATKLRNYGDDILTFSNTKSINLKNSRIIDTKQDEEVLKASLYKECKQNFEKIFKEYSSSSYNYASIDKKIVYWVLYKVVQTSKKENEKEYYMYKFDLNTNSSQLLFSMKNAYTTINFSLSPSERFMYVNYSTKTDGNYGTVRNLYDLKESKLIMNMNTEEKATLNGYLQDEKYVLINKTKYYKSVWEIINLKTLQKVTNFQPGESIDYVGVTKDFIIAINDKKEILKFYKFENSKIAFYKEYKTPALQIAILKDKERFAVRNSNAGITFFKFNNEKPIVSYYPLEGNNYVVTTEDGQFDASQGALPYLYCTAGTQVLPLESLFENYYSPGLMQQMLYGEGTNLATRLHEKIDPVPLVKIISPKNQSISNSKETTIEVLVTDQGGGIDELRLYHNNKLVETSQRGFKQINKSEKNRTQKFTINLVNGANTIKASAFNSQRLESVPDVITIMYEGQKATSNLYLLTIGINQYKNSSYQLKYAVSDAELFTQLIKNNSEGIYNEVVTKNIVDHNGTKTQIKSAFEEIIAKANAEDVFIFFYAGHGAMSKGLGDKKDFHLILQDITNMYGDDKMVGEKGISAGELMEFSKKIKAQKQLFFLDACESGGAIETFAMRGAAEEKAILQLARSTGIGIMAAAGSEQSATEFKELGHGNFTYAIKEGLECQADGGMKDKKITIYELIAWINDRIPELTEKYKGEAQYPRTRAPKQDFPIVICK